MIWMANTLYIVGRLSRRPSQRQRSRWRLSDQQHPTPRLATRRSARQPQSLGVHGFHNIYGSQYGWLHGHVFLEVILLCNFFYMSWIVLDKYGAVEDPSIANMSLSFHFSGVESDLSLAAREVVGDINRLGVLIQNIFINLYASFMLMFSQIFPLAVQIISQLLCIKVAANPM